MASANDDAAAMLREYAELLSITGGDPFRARNYEKAAKAVAGYPGDLGAVPDTGLTKIPGVGTSIAGKIAEYRRTGAVAAVDELRAKVPPGVLQIAKVPGVGPKRALQLSRELGIGSVADLDAAVRAGRLRSLSGFGAKSEERILRSIGVIIRDQPLRDALRSLPSDASHDQIEAVLAATIPAANGDKDQERPHRGQGPPRRPAHPHQPDRRDRVARGHGRRRQGTGVSVLRGHRPRAQPGDAADDRREDARCSGRRWRRSSSGWAWPCCTAPSSTSRPTGRSTGTQDFLDGFDLCVASVHSSFDQDRATMTNRFITAVENPYVNIIGHPLTRKLGRRPPVDVDLPALYDACARTGTALEINASPERMDLPPEDIRTAREAGVKFAIDTDAHSIVRP